MVQEQIAEIERERDTAPTPCEATERKRHLLLRLKSIGPAISALLSREVYYRWAGRMCGWRPLEGASELLASRGRIPPAAGGRP
jgi:hypothetical protein